MVSSLRLFKLLISGPLAALCCIHDGSAAGAPGVAIGPVLSGLMLPGSGLGQVMAGMEGPMGPQGLFPGQGSPSPLMAAGSRRCTGTRSMTSPPPPGTSGDLAGPSMRMVVPSRSRKLPQVALPETSDSSSEEDLVPCPQCGWEYQMSGVGRHARTCQTGNRTNYSQSNDGEESADDDLDDGDEMMEELTTDLGSEVLNRIKEFSGENKLKSYKIINKFMPNELKEFKNEVSIIDRSTTGEAGQGLDFVQEEFLKKGMAVVKMGKIVGFEVFQEGIRNSYHSDQANPKTPTNRKKRFFKWELEVKSACLVQLCLGNSSLVAEETDLGLLDEDLLNIEEKGLRNLNLFYSNFISGLKIVT